MCSSDNCNDDRRSFLAGATATVVGFAALPGQAVSSQTKQPETRVLGNPAVQHGRVIFKHNGMDAIDGYLARPQAEGVYPAVLVIAGNKISEEYIPNNNEAYSKYIANHTVLDILDDIQAGASYLRAQPFVSPGGIGALGFCFGGRLAMLFGARSREIDAVVPFHPAPMKQQEVARLKAPVQIHHGTADRSVAMTETQKTEQMLRAQGTPVEVFLYEGADHGFLAYTRPFYKADAAKLAWARATRFLRKYLR